MKWTNSVAYDEDVRKALSDSCIWRFDDDTSGIDISGSAEDRPDGVHWFVEKPDDDAIAMIDTFWICVQKNTPEKGQRRKVRAQLKRSGPEKKITRQATADAEEESGGGKDERFLTSTSM